MLCARYAAFTRRHFLLAAHAACSCSYDDCSYLIKLGCCKILLGLYKTKDGFGFKPKAGHAPDSVGVSSSAESAAAECLVVPSAMVAAAFAVLLPLLDAGFAADVCGAGLMDDIGSTATSFQPPAITASSTSYTMTCTSIVTG